MTNEFPNFPLLSLRSFEAVARHGSVRLAAQELHITSSAVSHALTKLETELGIELFTRKGRSIRLNFYGEKLYKHVDDGFDRIREGLSSVSSREAFQIRIHSAPSFAAQWLTPRLASFLVEYPEMEVLLSADTNYTRFAVDDFDVDIVYGRQANPNTIEISLGTEVVRPMCAPRLAAKLRMPKDLHNSVLIWSTLKKVSWNDWFLTNHLERPQAAAAMRFDRSFLSISAAVGGLGVVLESVRLAERELASGSLVTVFDDIAIPLTYAPYYLVFPKKNRNSPAVRRFVGWIEQRLKDAAV
jgi:DNA-binding transcriptional LysR family regulator